MYRKHPIFFLFVTLILFSAFLIGNTTSVNGFWYAWSTGEAHNSITEKGVEKVKIAYQDERIRFTKQAIKDISKANMDVDLNLKTRHDPVFHFDNELLEQSSNRLITQTQTIIDLITQFPPDAEQARIELGSTLHTLQDFYAHSNWVDMGQTTINTNLGRNTLTHSPNINFCPAEPHILDTSLTQLTTGYHLGDDGCNPPPPGKCLHGHLSGWEFDFWGTQFGCEGISKDPPYSTNHTQAANLAIVATEDYVNYILEADDVKNNLDAIRALTGQVAVTLILDASGSMAENDPQDIRLLAAKAAIDKFQLGHRVSVVAFNGSSTIIAPMTTIESEADRDALKAAIDQIGSEGSTDIGNALDAGYALLLDDYTVDEKFAVLLTDGDGSYTFDDYNQYTLQGWPIITACLSNLSCGFASRAQQGGLSEISQATGGQHYYAKRAEDLPGIFSRVANTFMGETGDFITDIRLTTNSQQQVSTYIPAHQSMITFDASWFEGEVDMNLITPSGTQIDATIIDEDIVYLGDSSYHRFVIDNPESGLWLINFSGGNMPPDGGRVNLNLALRQNFVRKTYLPLVSTRQIVKSETFNTPSSGWYEDESASTNWSYEYGEYEIGMRNADWWSAVRSPYLETIGDYTLATDVRRQNGSDQSGISAAGLLFEWQDWGDFHYFSVSPEDQSYLIAYYNGIEFQLLQYSQSDTVRTSGLTNQLKVIRSGNQFTFFINGTHVETLTNVIQAHPTSEAGYFTTSGANLTHEIITRFDNFVLTDATNSSQFNIVNKTDLAFTAPR